jgi:hypothetical protein
MRTRWPSIFKISSPSRSPPLVGGVTDQDLPHLRPHVPVESVRERIDVLRLERERLRFAGAIDREREWMARLVGAGRFDGVGELGDGARRWPAYATM